VEGDILEITMFRAKPGIEPDTFRQHATMATAWLKARQGYRGRTLVEEDGLWIDIVRWASREDADAATAAFTSAAELADFMAGIDLDTAQMHHGKIVTMD
jgi:hypothetical protein